MAPNKWKHHEGVNEGLCAFCALRKHVNIALSSFAKVIEPDELVDHLCSILFHIGFYKTNIYD